MKTVHFSILGNVFVRLLLPSRIEFGPRELLLAQAYVPGLKLSEPVADDRLAVTLRLSPTDPRTYAGNGVLGVADKIVELLVPLDDRLPHDVYHLLYAMVRNILMGADIYCVHAACVVFRNLNLLIVGHSGHGKTAITCELMRKSGAKLVSGNKTAIALVGESLLAMAGTPTITVGDADSAAASELFGHGLSYGGRLAFAPNGSQCQEPPVCIDGIVLVRLNDGYERFEPLAPESALHRLYPFFMDAVNADVVLCGGNEVYRARPPQAETILARSLTKALRRFPVWTCSGSKRFIVESLESL